MEMSDFERSFHDNTSRLVRTKSPSKYIFILINALIISNLLLHALRILETNYPVSHTREGVIQQLRPPLPKNFPRTPTTHTLRLSYIIVKLFKGHIPRILSGTPLGPYVGGKQPQIACWIQISGMETLTRIDGAVCGAKRPRKCTFWINLRGRRAVVWNSERFRSPRYGLRDDTCIRIGVQRVY